MKKTIDFVVNFLQFLINLIINKIIVFQNCAIGEFFFDLENKKCDLLVAFCDQNPVVNSSAFPFALERSFPPIRSL